MMHVFWILKNSRIDSDSAAIPTKPANVKIFDEKPALILKNIAPVEEKLEVLDEDEEDEEEKENEMEDGNEGWILQKQNEFETGSWKIRSCEIIKIINCL